MANGGVTLKDIYEALESLEEKIDRKISRNEHRISKLEGWRDRMLGAMAIISIPFIWTFINQTLMK
jgi:ribosome-associated translation inhibitor RaiA